MSVLIYFEYIDDQKMLWSGTDDCYPSHMKVTPVDGIYLAAAMPGKTAKLAEMALANAPPNKFAE